MSEFTHHAFEFKPGGPKSSITVDYNDLKSAIDSGVKILGAKDIGQGFLKILTDGESNFTIRRSKRVESQIKKFFPEWDY